MSRDRVEGGFEGRVTESGLDGRVDGAEGGK